MSGFRIIALLLICCTSGFAHSASGPVVQTEYGKVEIVSYMRSEWCNLAANRLFYFIFFLISHVCSYWSLHTTLPCCTARHTGSRLLQRSWSECEFHDDAASSRVTFMHTYMHIAAMSMHETYVHARMDTHTLTFYVPVTMLASLCGSSIVAEGISNTLGLVDLYAVFFNQHVIHSAPAALVFCNVYTVIISSKWDLDLVSVS